MIHIKRHTKIGEIEKNWISLQEKNKTIDSFCHYEFVKRFVSGIVNKIKKIIGKSKITYFEVFEDEKLIMILPLEERDGKYFSLDTLDFFDLVTDKEVKKGAIFEALKKISAENNKEIIIQNFRADFNTFEILEKDVDFVPSEKYVEIKFNNNYDDYYLSLSKHARQNLRTAYNRVKTDGLELKFEFGKGKTSKKIIQSLKKIYFGRRVSKYKNMSKLKKMVFSIDDPISNVCFTLKNSFYTAIYLNNKPVAFMAGIITDKEYIVPRLAIDDKLARYSPGIILINETIKELIKNNIYCLNLAKGEEGYKYQMGGQEKQTYKFSVCSNKK